jgi:hypothetical protein
LHVTITSFSSEEAFLKLAKFSNSLESAINPLIQQESYGSIARLMLVVVAVEATQEENLAWCKKHNKIGTYTHPLTKDKVKYCSIAVPFGSDEIVSTSDGPLRRRLISEIVAIMANPVPKMPKDFEYSKLVNRLMVCLWKYFLV